MVFCSKLKTFAFASFVNLFYLSSFSAADNFDPDCARKQITQNRVQPETQSFARQLQENHPDWAVFALKNKEIAIRRPDGNFCIERDDASENQVIESLGKSSMSEKMTRFVWLVTPERGLQQSTFSFELSKAMNENQFLAALTEARLMGDLA